MESLWKWIAGCKSGSRKKDAGGHKNSQVMRRFMETLKFLFQYISNKTQSYTVYFIWKPLYMFRVVSPPIIRSANNCIYSIWYLSHSYCYLPLPWKSWNRFECAVGGLGVGVGHPQHTQTSSNSSTIAADSTNGVKNSRCCRYSCLHS